ncbi:MAG: DNA mismatch repair endonuclease MutL, partial [Pseudomonadota bacterium]
GGRALIRVADDGAGIAADQLALAVERHATSKIDGSDLVNIATLGFRGEALPSIGAVARLTILSRPAEADAAAEIAVSAGRVGPVRPAARAPGTTVEVRDLFSATPARLKFLKTARAETQAVGDMLRRLALAVPHVGLTLEEEVTGAAPRRLMALDPARDGDGDGDGGEGAARVRAEALIGAAMTDAVWIEVAREGLVLSGLAGLPSAARGTAMHQYLAVNGRPVRDRLLLGAVRAGYGDFLVRGRHPVFALALDCPAAEVDVNVHPAKAEVRFRDSAAVRSLVVGALRRALGDAAPVGGARADGAALAAWRPAGIAAAAMAGMTDPAPAEAQPAPGGQAMPRVLAPLRTGRSGGEWRPEPRSRALPGLYEAAAAWQAPDPLPGDPGHADPPHPEAPAAPDADAADATAGDTGHPAAERPLGEARAQLHGTYILAETAGGIVLVDQHAAHERLVLERLRAERARDGVRRQGLLIPEIVTLGPDAEAVLAVAPQLEALGLVIEGFGPGTLCVREVPALLGQADPARLLRDVAEEVIESGTAEALAARLDAVLSRMACHGSVRAGRALTRPEMDALLRAIEATPGAQWCNHGRPTAVTLDRAQIERLFERR